MADNGDQAASSYVVPDSKPGRVPTKDFKPLTFNIEDVKRTMLLGTDGDHTKLTKKQQGQLKTLSKLDNDGDGEISLMEIIALEEHLEDTEKQNKRMKRILCAIMLGLFMFLGAMMCMGIAAIEITKESRVRGGTPVATSGSSAALPASSSGRRRLGGRGLIDPASTIGEKWDKRAAMEPPAVLAEPKDPIDVSMEAKYVAMEGMTGKEKQAKHKEDKFKHCDECKKLIEAEHAAPPADGIYPSLEDPECLKCEICLYNDGATTQIVPTHDCPTMKDPVKGEKPVIDTLMVKYGLGSDESPITMTQDAVEWTATVLKKDDPAVKGAVGVDIDAHANYKAYEMLSGLQTTIVKGAPRTFVADGSTSPEHLETVTEIVVSCPGNPAIDDLTFEGAMTPEETDGGFGNMAKFTVAAGGPAGPDGVVRLGADGTIAVSKSLQEEFVHANQLGDATNLDPERPEGTMMLPYDNACYVKAKGTTSPTNKKPEEVRQDTAPPMGVDMEKYDPLKMELAFEDYPAMMEPPPPMAAFNMDFTTMKQCDHPEAAHPCSANDPGVQEYILGHFTDDDGVEHPIPSLFHEEHGTITSDEHHEMIEMEGEYTMDDLTGVAMAESEVTMVTHTPDGMDDLMMKEMHTMCQGMYCHEMVKDVAPHAKCNFDGSMTCGEHECITGDIEFKAAASLPPAGGNEAMHMGPMAGDFMQMHEGEVENKVRRLKEKHRRLSKNSKKHKRNVKTKYHPLLAAHAYRRLVAPVAAKDLTLYESPTTGIMVEDCNAAHQYEIDNDDMDVIAKQVPKGPHPVRRLRARRRLLAAKRHALSKHAFHRKMLRVVRKAHLRARRVAKAHHKTRRRLMDMETPPQFEHDPNMMHDIDTAAPKFDLGPHGAHAMELAHDVGHQDWMNDNFEAALDAGMGTPEYYAEESVAQPGDVFAAPVEYAATQKAATCGAATCDTTHTFKEMEVAMDHMAETVAHLETVEKTCFDFQVALTTTAAADQFEFFQQNVEPCNHDLAEAEFEVHHANHTQHSAALSFRAEQNMYAAEEYLVDHMYEYVETADAAGSLAADTSFACHSDTTQACTPATFDYEHFHLTGETWDHEPDDPMSAFPDFEANNNAYVANHHVDEAVDALIGMGASLEAMDHKMAPCTYTTFPHKPSSDGGAHFTRTHEMQFHPDSLAPYRRLKQHDYGRRLRKLRGETRGASEMGRGSGTARTQERTTERVNERVDRMSNERGTSAVTETFREREMHMERRPEERERENPRIENPREEVRDTRQERASRSEASERSESTRDTTERVMERRGREIDDCADTMADGDRNCGGCTRDFFSTAPGGREEAKCISVCEAYHGCETEVDRCAREMVVTATERSTSLTGGRDERVQVQRRDEARDERGDPGRDENERDTRRDEDERDTRREDGIPERDARAYDNARERIDTRMRQREVRTVEEDTRRREVVARDTRARIDTDREEQSGRRPRSEDKRVDTRVTRDQRRRGNTSFDDVTDSARPVRSAEPYTDPRGRRIGHLEEPMPDLRKDVRCTGRPMPNCTAVVTHEPCKDSPMKVEMQHNVNGPDDYVREQIMEEKAKKKEQKQAKRKQDEQTRKQDMKDAKKADRLAKTAAKKADAKAARKAKRQEEKRKRKGLERRRLLQNEDEAYDEPGMGMENVTSCSSKLKDKMCFGNFIKDEQTGLPSVIFGDKEKGEFRLFFEIHEKNADEEGEQKICMSMDYCGVVSLDAVTISGQATFPTKVANRIANQCLDATGDAQACCPGTGKMTKDVSQATGKEEFFVCDTSSMNTDSLVSPTFPVDLTIRHETDIEAPVIELSDLGHAPMHIADGITVDFHFFQEFFPTYASVGEFCAGFDVSSELPGFDPDCPECSTCNDDGTQKKCMEHSNWKECEMDPGCLYNNMTKKCHSLPGNDNMPKVESNKPPGCEHGTAYCRSTKSGKTACVPVVDGKCFNCMDSSVFDHPERVRVCGTPSGPTCNANGQMYCAESRKCVDHCHGECHHRGNSTGIAGIDITITPHLVGDPKTHVCAIPNPNVCRRLGKVFCELNQDCVEECADWACQKDMGASGMYNHHFTQLSESRADQGVRFHSANNYAFYGNATSCGPVTKASCKADGEKFLCKTQWSTECVDKCNQCDGTPAGDKNTGECVRPKALSQSPITRYYCPTSGDTVTTCSGTNCVDWNNDALTIQSGNYTCAADPNFQRPGMYRCNIQTAKQSVEYDVQHCASECHLWDKDSNNHLAKKKHVDHGASNTYRPQRTCEVADKDACVRAGMAWCPNDQTAKEDGTFTGECVMDCHNCYIPVRADDKTDKYTPANVQHLPLPVNKSGTCVEQKDMRQECKGNGHYWCEGSQMCSADCSDCTDTLMVWGHNEVSYMWEETEKVVDFHIPNSEAGTCDAACPDATANVEYKYDWGGWGPYEQSQPEAYCPLTKTCLRPNNFPYNRNEDPVIGGMDTEWKEDTACKDHCGRFGLTKWDWEAGSRACIEQTKENCVAQWKVWCPTTRQCLDSSSSCEEDCPGLPFRPPHGVEHQKYDATSCMATKEEVAEKCRNPADYGWDWQSSTTKQMYCSPPGDGYAHCTDNCDWCSQWKDGDSKPSRDDGNGFCSFKSIVTTHFEPVDMHVPEYNHTVHVEEDGTTWETWTEVNYTANFTEESSEFIEVVDPWCDETAMSVPYCEECGMTYSPSGEFVYSKMVADEAGTTCIWPEKVYGCTDMTADNYDPHATHLEEGEVCPAGDTNWCGSCEYASYNNTFGYTAEALPADQLDYYGMPMNLSAPEPDMYNYTMP